MKHSKSSLFLMELIISILFFALASTVCIRLFAKAHLLSKQTVNETEASTLAQNLAEVYIAADGDLQKMVDMMAQTSLDEPQSCVQQTFDEDWKPCNENPVFAAKLQAFPEQDGLISADIIIQEVTTATDEKPDSDNSIIYSLHIVHHVPERISSHE